MRKNQVIDEILYNPTYQMNSGVCVNLRKALLKLPFKELCNLRLIIDMKLSGYQENVE